MKAGKVHLFSPDPERFMPIDISKRMYQDGYRGAACGYMRRSVVYSEQKDKVTCFYCLRKI